MYRLALAGATAAMIASCGLLELAYADTALLNASYEPTRRFYSDLNKAFAAHWQAEQGEARAPSSSSERVARTIWNGPTVAATQRVQFGANRRWLRVRRR